MIFYILSLIIIFFSNIFIFILDIVNRKKLSIKKIEEEYKHANIINTILSFILLVGYITLFYRSISFSSTYLFISLTYLIIMNLLFIIYTNLLKKYIEKKYTLRVDYTVSYSRLKVIILFINSILFYFVLLS